MKKVLFLVEALTILSFSLADTKVLHNVKIQSNHSERTETFSLKNANTPEEELVIDGNYMLSIFPANDPEHFYKIVTFYIADKDGYRVKYKLVLQDKVPFSVQVTAASLKTLAG